MIHFKPKIHFAKWQYYFLEFATRQHRKCTICGKEQISNSITGKNHTHWINK